MFEKETNIIQAHIDYLNGILSEDLDTSEDFDEEGLRERLQECEEDISDVESSLPYDELDDDGEQIEDFSGDNLDDGELEDEVVQIEGLINELRDLMQKVEDLHLDDPDEPGYEGMAIQNACVMAEEQFKNRVGQWLQRMISEKSSKDNLNLDSQTIKRMSIAIFIAAKCRGEYETSEKLAQETYPEYRLDKDTIRKYHLFSPGMFHIAFDMIKDYEMLHEMMDFNRSLNYHMNFWKDIL